jgi:hypothetical protein
MSDTMNERMIRLNVDGKTWTYRGFHIHICRESAPFRFAFMEDGSDGVRYRNYGSLLTLADYIDYRIRAAEAGRYPAIVPHEPLDLWDIDADSHMGDSH